MERNLALFPQETFAKSSKVAPTSPAQVTAMRSTPGGTLKGSRSLVEGLVDGPTSHLQGRSWRHLLAALLGTSEEATQLKSVPASPCLGGQGS